MDTYTSISVTAPEDPANVALVSITLPGQVPITFSLWN